VKYSIALADSALQDIYGNYSKADKFSFTSKGAKDYSTLSLTVIHPKDGYQYILQLIDENETRVVQSFTITQTTTLNLDYVLPAKYLVKLIRDANMG
jgi:hypothetical protein